MKIQTIRKDEGTWFFVVVVMCVKIRARRMEILIVSHTIEFSANIPLTHHIRVIQLSDELIPATHNNNITNNNRSTTAKYRQLQ